MEKVIPNRIYLPSGELLSDKGSCSKIITISSDKCFKLFNKEYRSLKKKENRELLETIELLSQLSNLERVITPEDIYRTKKRLYGYTMSKIDGTSLEKLSPTTSLELMINEFLELEDDVYTLSQEHLKLEDISLDNFLFNSSLFLLDLDLSIIDRDSSFTDIYRRNMQQLFRIMQQVLYGEEIKTCNFDSDVAHMHQDILNGDSTEYIEFVEYIQDYLSERARSEMVTIGDNRKIYQKVIKKGGIICH